MAQALFPYPRQLQTRLPVPRWLAGWGCVNVGMQGVPLALALLFWTRLTLGCGVGLLHLYAPTGIVPIPPKPWTRLATSSRSPLLLALGKSP